jgi:hypothetical protein
MLFSLLYMVLRVIFRLVPPGDERDREVEILKAVGASTMCQHRLQMRGSLESHSLLRWLFGIAVARGKTTCQRPSRLSWGPHAPGESGRSRTWIMRSSKSPMGTVTTT